MGLKNKITREYLYRRIGEKNIFEFYFGRPIEIGKAYNSFFTKDSDPSTGFYVSQSGKLLYNDLRNNEKLDCIEFAKKSLEKETYHDTLNQIAVDFGIIKGVLTKDKVGVIKPFKNEIKKKEKVKITIKVKNYTKRDLEFWGKYQITKEELIKYNIVSILWYEINGYSIYIKDELCFGYLIYDDKGELYIKIYRPCNKEYKWTSNVPLNCVQGLDDIDSTGDFLIVAKSLKDYIVIKKFYKNCIYSQNESKVAISKEVIKVLKKCYKYIYINYDLDRPGIVAASYYKNKYEFIPIFIGSSEKNIWQNLQFSKKYNTKDISDYTKVFGMELTKKMIEKFKCQEYTQ